jgi:hypothetical protein
MNRRETRFLPLALAGLILLLLHPLLLSGEVLRGRDLAAFVYPLYSRTTDLIRAGELPLWNIHQFAGYPLAGNAQAALFYPGTWLVWLLGVDRGIGVVLALHLWWAGWGMAVLTRRYGATRFAALLAGLVYATTEFIGARLYAGHYTLVLVFAWIPWTLAAFHTALHGDRQRWRAAAGAGVCLGVAALAGHPPLLFYLGLLLIGMALLAGVDGGPSSLLRVGRTLLMMLVIGGLIGAAQLLPTAELTLQSVREAADTQFFNAFALPPAQLLTLLVGGFFGLPTVEPVRYWGADFYEEMAAYAGVLPLLAVMWAAWKLPRVGRYFLALMVVGVVLSLGLQGVLLPLLVRWIPGFALFRAPGRSLYFVVLGMSGLLALAVTHLQQMISEERKTLLDPLLRRGLPVLIAAVGVEAFFFSGWYASASHVEPMPTRAMVIASAFATTGLVLGGAWWILRRWQQPILTRGLLGLTLFLLLLDGWRIPIQLIETQADWRDPLWQGAVINVPTGADARVVQRAANSPVNGAMFSGHQHVAGYDPLAVGSFAALQALGDPFDPLSPVNTLLGVRYLLTSEPFDHPQFRLIGIADGGIYYERTDPFPRAWVAGTISVEADDARARTRIQSGSEDWRQTVILDQAVECPGAGGDAVITTYGANEVVIETSGAGGMLVLSDQYFPGWTVTVDGQPGTIRRAFTALRAVCVPAGTHSVHFRYQPLSVLVGIGLSAVGLLLALVCTRRRVARG